VKLKTTRIRIALDEIGTEDLGEPPLRRTPPEIHLKQPILRLHESLRQEQIGGRFSVDVWHTPPIAHDADRRGHAVDLDRSADRRQKQRRRRTVPAAERDDRHERGRRGPHYTTGMAMKDGLLAEFDHEMGVTRRLLDRLPDDKMATRPHDRSMSLGGLATHIANLPNWTAIIMNQAGFDMAEAPPKRDELTSRAAVLADFDTSVRAARALLDKTDAELVAPWTLKRSGQQIFTMPRMGVFRSFVMSHTIHHRGQLSVYLRLNNIPVPAIYGPSADEG